MECKITFTKRRACSGATLVEMLVASGILIIVASTLAVMYVYFLQGFASLENYMSMTRLDRFALDVMSKEIRQADCVTAYSSNSVTIKTGTNLVTYAYSAADKEITRTSNGHVDSLVSGCDYLRYDIFQRSPTNGSYDLYPAATAANCKVVQVSWICSRDILGRKLNTSTALSSKVVIRKQK